MSESNLPEEVKQFMEEYITSLFQLETLLLLYDNREAEWSVEDADRELHIGPEFTEKQLTDLHTRGLLAHEKGPPSRYRYNPSSDQLDQAVRALAREYSERRVRVISFLFSKPLDKVRIFPDAFRVRKDK